MNTDQLHSIIRSLLKVAGAVLAAHGLAATAGWLNSDDVSGLLVLLAGVWQSHHEHSNAGINPGGAESSPPAPSAPAAASAPATAPAAAAGQSPQNPQKAAI